MSRRKTNPEEIRNPAGYFAKYIAMENKRTEIDKTEYYKVNVSLESLIIGGEEGVGKAIRRCFVSSLQIKSQQEIKKNLQTQEEAKESTTKRPPRKRRSN